MCSRKRARPTPALQVADQLIRAPSLRRSAEEIAALLGEVTGDGIVFRVDLRLRPNGDVGPLAVSLGMLEEYFIVQGREWERYAWIKARVVNQAHAQSPESFKQSVRGLHDVVRPFVFRRYLDFNVLAALRELHSQIRQEAARRALGRESHMGGQYPPVDIKLGPGGIREVEFIAQLFQLIRGGKEEPLRARGTREVLTYLSTSGRLDIEEVAMLQEATNSGATSSIGCNISMMHRPMFFRVKLRLLRMLQIQWGF
jgi:[glutamine synthetase] adenylyltransferase / [glutamine synthetase]-adenylyl-L-tyrosine phosphorylase